MKILEYDEKDKIQTELQSTITKIKKNHEYNKKDKVQIELYSAIRKIKLKYKLQIMIRKIKLKKNCRVKQKIKIK